MTRRAAGTANMAADDVIAAAAARYKPLPPRPTALAASVSGRVDRGKRQRRLGRWTGTADGAVSGTILHQGPMIVSLLFSGVGPAQGWYAQSRLARPWLGPGMAYKIRTLGRWTGATDGASGGTVAGRASNSTPDLPEEHAHGSPTVDHVQQRVDGAVTERHDLTDRQHLVQLDLVVGVDSDQTHHEVRRPAQDESRHDQHGHLHHGPLRRQRESGHGGRSGRVRGPPALVRLEADGAT